jgi:ribose/xylose/arabinose/galactoside ABC-type transport system permease subunit
LLSVDPYFQLVAKGGVILLAVLLDQRLRSASVRERVA